MNQTQMVSETQSDIDYQWLQYVPADDQPLIVALIEATNASDPIVGFAQQSTQQEILNYLARLDRDLKDNRCHLMLGKAADNALACMVILVPCSSPNNRHMADMSKGMINHRYRGTGVLYHAFLSIAAQCRQLAVELLTLDVRDNTPAYHIWQRCGFETYGTLQDYARSNGKVFAGHYMQQTVNALEKRMHRLIDAS